MNYYQEIVEAILQLTDRYGITLTEVPDRLREKVLVITRNLGQEDLDKLLLPLSEQIVRPIRVKAGNKVSPAALARVIDAIDALDGYSREDAEKVAHTWMKVFSVQVGQPVYESDKSDFVTPSEDFTIKDDICVITNENVERVFNPFDDDKNSPVTIVADYDGKFTDTSFEDVADFSISDAENLVTEKVEGFNGASNNGKFSVEKPKAVEKKKASSPKKADKAPIFQDNDSNQAVAASRYVLDDAFKELRNCNYEMASKIMMELARAGDTRAQFHLGEFYQMGTGVEMNQEKAKYWFRKASGRGSIPAKNKLVDLENENEQGGCLGCAFTAFIIIVVIKFIGSIF